MKHISFLLIFVSIIAFGKMKQKDVMQNDDWYVAQWKEISSFEEEKRPASAMKLARKLEKAARKENNYDERLRAFEKIAELQYEISWRDVAPIVEELISLESEFVEERSKLYYNITVAKLLDRYGTTGSSPWTRSELYRMMIEYSKTAIKYVDAVSQDKKFEITLQVLETLRDLDRGEYYQSLAKQLIEESQDNAKVNIIANVEYSDYYYWEDERKLELLDSLINKYKESDDVVLAMTKELQIRSDLYDEDEFKDNYFQRLSDECDQICKDYPKSEYLNGIKNIQESFGYKYGSLHFSNQLYPNETSIFRLSHRNIHALVIEISRKDDASDIVWKRKIKLQSPLNIEKETSIKVQMEDIGNYVVVCKDLEGERLAKEELTVSRVGFIVRNSGNNVKQAVYAADFMTGKPFREVQVEASRYNSSKILKEDIVLDGFTSFLENKLVDDRNYQIKVNVGEDKFSLPSSTYVTSSFRFHQEIETMDVEVFTDRKRYRPNDKVAFKAIGYIRGENARLMEEGEVFIAELLSPKNKVVEKLPNLKTDKWGSVSGSFIIPTESQSGSYTIRIKTQTKSVGSAWINVDEFAIPYFELELKPERDDYRIGDSISFVGSVNSLTGHILEGSEIRYSVKNVKEGIVKTDKEGQFRISFRSLKKEGDSSIYYNVEASAVAPNGETHKVERSICVYSKPYAVRTNNFPSLLVKEEKKEIKIAIVSRSTGAKKQGINGRYYITKHNKKSKLLEGSFVSTELLDIDWSKLPSNDYRIVFASEDADSLELEFTLFSRTDTDIPTDETVFFYPLNSEIETGENIEFLFGTNAKTFYATYDLYDREYTELFKGNIVMEKGMKLYSIPYDASYPEDVKLQLASIYDGKTFDFNANYKRVKVEKELKMSFISLRDRREPGTKEQFSIEVKNNLGEPQEANIVLTAYNKASDYPFNYVFSNLSRRSEIWYAFRLNESGSFRNNYAYLGVSEDVMFESADMGIGAPRMMKSMNTESNFGEEEVTEEDSIVEESENNDVAERKDFSLTAAFLPNLKTDINGIAEVDFLYPDDLGTYKIMAMATTRDAYSVVQTAEVLVSKDVMVSAYLPQFLRRGDEVEIRALASNLTSDSLETTLHINSSVEVIKGGGEVQLILAPKSSQIVKFTVKVSGDTEVLNLRLDLEGQNHRDVEITQVPIIDAVGLYTKSKVLYGVNSDKVFDIEDFAPEQKGVNEEFTVNSYSPQELLLQTLPRLIGTDNLRSLMTLMDNWYLLSQGSKLVNDSDELMTQWQESLSSDVQSFTPSEEALSETPWRYDSPRSRYEHLQKWQDPKYIAGQINDYRRKVEAMQNTDGGFAWMPGMSSSPYVTLYYLDRAYQIDSTNVNRLAVYYLDDYMAEQMDKNNDELDSMFILNYLRFRSVLLEKFPIETKDKDVFEYYLKRAEKSWKKHSIQGRVIIATTLNNLGRKIDKIVTSISEYAVKGRDGSICFPNAVMPFRGMINSEVNAHIQILKLFSSLSNRNQELENGIALWLMYQRRNQTWEHKGIAIDAAAILWKHYDELVQEVGEVGDVRFTEVLYSCELPMDQILAAGNGFEIVKRIYKVNASGEEEISQDINLSVGDEVVVRYSVKNSDNRNFVHLKCLRTGALKTIDNVSGYSWGYYKEIKSNETNYYFYTLPEGNNLVEERFFVEYAGKFSDAYARIESVLAPVYFGNTETKVVSVSE